MLGNFGKLPMISYIIVTVLSSTMMGKAADYLMERYVGQKT